MIFKNFLRNIECNNCGIRKRKETNLLVYGNEVSMNSEEIKIVWMENNKNKTQKEKDAINNKRKKTTFLKYGYEYSLQVPEVIEKGLKTNMIKYGYRYCMQNPIMFGNSQRNCNKKYTLPSWKIISLQGYENFAMDILLKNYEEDEIITSSKDESYPKIMYQHKNKTKRYFPDFIIPSKNKIIEIKSTYTYRINLIQNIFKALAVRKLNIIMRYG